MIFGEKIAEFKNANIYARDKSAFHPVLTVHKNAPGLTILLSQDARR